MTKKETVREKRQKRKENPHPAGRPLKYSKERLQEIGKELLDWCKQDGNWHISGYEIQAGLPIGFCSNMSSDRPDEFSKVYSHAKHILGNKILTQSMGKGADRWVVNTLVPHYIKDIDHRLDSQKQKELEMAEKAKKLAETEQDEKAVIFIEKLDKVSEKDD